MIHAMPEPTDEVPDDADESPEPPAGGDGLDVDADESAATPSQRREPSRRNLWHWVGPVALAVALVAIGIAVWALVRQPAGAASPTSQQIADAKGRACTAFTTVRTAVSVQTHANLGPDPVAIQAVGANGRLAMVAGATYLNAHLDPATPADLATAIRSFATDLQEIPMNAMAGLPRDDPNQAARLRDGEALSVRIADMCK
jgi:hypothetical protein